MLQLLSKLEKTKHVYVHKLAGYRGDASRIRIKHRPTTHSHHDLSMKPYKSGWGGVLTTSEFLIG